MKILLTGAAGFLGGRCIESLRALGMEVVSTDRRGDVDVLGDLADQSFAERLPPVDWVVHAAAVQYVSGDLPVFGRTAYFHRNNVVATINLCRRYGNSSTRFLNIGTSMMYRQGAPEKLGTRAPMVGQGVYSSSKLVAQEEIERHFERWATLIPCIIGGPGRGGLFNGFVRSILRRGSVWLPGRASHPTQMVHVDDVVALVGLMVTSDARGFFNAGAPRPLSIVEWVYAVASELKVGSVSIRHLPLAPLSLMAMLSGYTLLAREQILMLTYPHVLDTSESERLGWRPIHDNTKIVRDTAAGIAAKTQ